MRGDGRWRREDGEMGRGGRREDKRGGEMIWFISPSFFFF